MCVRNLWNQDNSERRTRPAISVVWMHFLFRPIAFPPFFFSPQHYNEQNKRENCLLVGKEGGTRNNLLAQSRVRSGRRPALLNTLGTLFGGLAVFLPPFWWLGCTYFCFSCRVAIDGSFSSCFNFYGIPWVWSVDGSATFCWWAQSEYEQVKMREKCLAMLLGCKIVGVHINLQTKTPKNEKKHVFFLWKCRYQRCRQRYCEMITI